MERSGSSDQRMYSVNNYDQSSGFDKKAVYNSPYRFIRKVVYMVSSARVTHVKRCCDELLSKISKSLSIYRTGEKAHFINYMEKALDSN
jgi:hypothetical protein